MERATFTIAEAAKLLGIAPGTAYAAARSGGIPAVRVGRRLLVSRPALEKLLGGELTRENVHALDGVGVAADPRR